LLQPVRDVFTARYELNSSKQLIVFRLKLLWLSRYATGLSPRRPGFSPESVCVRFLVDGVALRVFSPITSVCPVRNIPLTFLTGLHVNTASTRGTNVPTKPFCFRYLAIHGRIALSCHVLRLRRSADCHSNSNSISNSTAL